MPGPSEVDQLREMLQNYSGLLGAFEPSERDKKAALSNALMAAGFGMLSTPGGNAWQAAGRGGLLGMTSYNQDLKDIQAQRMQNLQSVSALSKMNKDAQMTDMAMKMLNGGDMPGSEQGQPAMPAGPGMVSGGQPQGLPMGGGNPRAEVAFALMGKKDVADVLHRQYQVTQGPQGTLIRNGQVVGQVLPQGMVIDGKFQPLPKEATDAMIEHEARKVSATKQAEAPYQLHSLNLPGGGTQQVLGDQLQRVLRGEQGAPASLPGGFAGQSPTPQNQAQATEISKGQGADYLKIIESEKLAPANIGKYKMLQSYLSKVEGGKLAPETMALKAYVSWAFPEAAKEFTKDMPYSQAATALSREMALTLRNPAGGAGMPGALSDADRNYLESMIPSIANDPRSVPLLVDMKIKIEQRNQEIGSLARAYRSKNNGVIDDGFYEELRKYSDANPMFKDMPSLPVSNVERRGVIGNSGSIQQESKSSSQPAGTDKVTGKPLYRRADGKLYYTP